MKERLEIASATTPDGEKISLVQHDKDYAFLIGPQELMLSRQHASEESLATLGCERLSEHRNPNVLVGGLGMGFTLRTVLNLLPSGATIEVVELIPEIVQWNRQYLGDLADHPLRDSRVKVSIGDVMNSIRKTDAKLDALLLDVDNGPHALTHKQNQIIYSAAGIRAIGKALSKKGCVAIWSSSPDRSFEKRLKKEGFHVRWFRVPAYHGSKSANRTIWVASQNLQSLPDIPEKRVIS